MKDNTLSYLTDADWRVLREHARAIRYERDATIVREGEGSRGVMLLVSGSARVEQRHEGMAVTLARMAPGEVFGEMSLLEDTAASASVIADEPVTVEAFERGQIEALLQSDPGFAARFHRSIAVHLSRRLRERSLLFSQLNVQAVAQVNRFHATRLGQITARQLPRDLIAGVQSFTATMAAIEARPGPGAQEKVDEACARLLTLLARSTSQEALFEIGYADLSSFRDPSQLASGVGAYVFRQTFPWFMSAATVARAYMKPRGFAEDHATMTMVYEGDADGDGAVGPLLDRSYLARPICRSRRAAREQVTAILRAIVAGARPGEPLAIASLASGAGAEVLDLLADPAGAALRITCVDLDDEALAAGARRADELGAAARVAFVRGNVVPSPEGTGAASIGLHRAACALGLVEYLSDDESVRLLDWAFDALVPGGALVVTALAPDEADLAFMEHVLEWRLIRRNEAELAALFARSRFAAEPKVERDASGAGLVAVATKRA